MGTKKKGCLSEPTTDLHEARYLLRELSEATRPADRRRVVNRLAVALGLPTMWWALNKSAFDAACLRVAERDALYQGRQWYSAAAIAEDEAEHDMAESMKAEPGTGASSRPEYEGGRS